MLYACLVLQLSVVQTDDGYDDVVEAAPHDDQLRRRKTRVAGYILLGVGGAALTIGGVLIGAGQVAVADYMRDIDAYNAMPVRTQAALALITARQAESNRFTLIGVALAGVGLAGLITGLVLVLVGREPPVDIALGPGQLLLSGRF